MPTQKNSASWDLQLGFNLAFKRLIFITGITNTYQFQENLQPPKIHQATNFQANKNQSTQF